MKILMCVHDFLPEHVGGTELHTLQLAGGLVEAGQRVQVCTTERAPAECEGTVTRRTHGGLDVLEWVHQREYGDVEESWCEPLSSGVFAQLLEELRPDVVHFQHAAFLGAGCFELARGFGAAVVVTLHDFHLLCDRATLRGAGGARCDPERLLDCQECLARHPFRNPRWRGAGSAHAQAMAERLRHHARALAQAQAVIAPSRFLARAFERAGLLAVGRAQLLPAGYPGPLRLPRECARSGPLRVAYLGAVAEHKGVHVLVQAVAALARAGVPIQLDVHGPLEWFPEYSARLARLARGAPVRLHGRYSPQLVDRVLARADLVGLPSLWYENRPLVLHEAWRNGLAVVASDLGGLAEHVRHGVDGMLVPPADADALAQVLGALSADRAVLDHLAAGRPPLPTLESVVDTTVGIYRRCLDELHP